MQQYSPLTLRPQNPAPATPDAGLSLYADSAGLLSWRGANGFVRVVDSAALTADRTFTLPDKSGTVALLDDIGYADDNYAIPANILQPQAVGPEIATITTTTNGVAIGVANFDGLTVETANFSDMRPKNWDGANPTARFVWQAATGGTGAVTWGIAITAINEDDTPDVAPVFTEVNDAVVTTEEDQITAATAAIAIQGTLTADSRLQFWIRRNPADGGDNMSADARLISTVLTFALS